MNTNKLDKLIMDYKSYKRIIEDAKALQDEVKKAIIEELDGKDVYSNSTDKVSYKASERCSVTITDVKHYYPSIYNALREVKPDKVVYTFKCN